MNLPRPIFYKAVAALFLLMLLIQYLYFNETKSVPKMNSPEDSLFYIGQGASLTESERKISNQSQSQSQNRSLSPRTLEFLSESVFESSDSEAKLPEGSCEAQRKLVGFVKVDMNPPPLYKISQMHSDLELGGLFVPNCTHTDKVAIIVPFRDRQEHLRLFLYNIHPFLKRQLIEYNIYVIEQSGSDPFNRAMLFNVGFKEAMKKHDFTCFVFHDVDLIPENDRNIYSCPANPRHMSVAVDTMRYRLPYRTIFGGISAMRKEQFTRVNGFSNRYWGWGAEDDDMANRIAYHGLYISRYSPLVARYKMLRHKHQKLNVNRYQILHRGKLRFNTDGLSNLNYTVEEIVLNTLYTLVKVKLALT